MAEPADRPRAAELAAKAVVLAPGDPARAAALATRAGELARQEGDRRAAALAEHALGLAARARDDLDDAVRHLRRAAGLAETAGDAGLGAQVRVSLSGTLALLGRWAAALAQADRAAAHLGEGDLAVLQAQRAFLLGARGRLGEALDGYRRVIPVFRRTGDRFREARALANAAVIQAHSGALASAQVDLARAERLFDELGLERETADVRQNLGWVAARRGDMPEALTWFDRADESFARLGVVDAAALQDRCEALLSAHLLDEARRAAERAVAELDRRGMRPRLAEARLVLAEAALLQGELDVAADQAGRARRAFAAQGAPARSALARLVTLRVARRQGRRSAALLAAARSTAAALHAGGYAVPALDARIIAAQMALDLHRVEVAEEELAEARRARDHGPADRRSRAWHAEALLRLARGDRRGAEAALRAGLRVLDAGRAALGATELRAHASGHGADLAGLGLRLALDAHSPGRTLAWAERWRSASLAAPPARPPDDPLLAADLAELRQVTAEAEQAALGGRPLARLAARQAALERAVRDRCRRSPGAAPGPAAPGPPGPRQLRPLLGRSVLVEMVQCDGRLGAVVVTARSARLHDLGPSGAVADEVAAVHFALRRLAFARGTPRSLAAAGAALAHGAGRLDRLLLAPLAALGDLGDGDRPLVVVPTGALQAVPWSVLPSCAGRPVTVAPSAALWRRAAAGGGPAAPPPTGPPPAGPPVLVAGPGLACADDEVDALAGLYPKARRLTGAGASVAAVTAALDGAGLAHVAAHGRFRADNPLFSSLRLADGPLTVYELERLGAPPRVLVLSACDSAVADVRPGDELMGLGAAVLGLGTATLVASLLPVSDAAARPLMVALHSGLRAGLAPAAALARAQAGAAAGGDPEAVAAAAAFVCLGAG